MTKNELNRFRAVLAAKVAELERFNRHREGITIERCADQLEEIQAASQRALAVSSLDREYTEAALRHFQLRRSYHGFVVPAGDGVGASDMPDVPDGVQLCDQLLPDPKYCIGAVHGGPWRFTARSSDGTVTTW